MLQRRAHIRDREAGLSLIEILVGISILAVVAFAVTLSLDPGKAPLEAEADRLAARLDRAGREAIATGQPVGLVIAENGARYDFYRYLDGRWWPLDEASGLAGRRLEGEVRLAAPGARPAADGGAAGPVPVLWFDPAGLTGPFLLELEESGGRIALAWDGQGHVERREDA